MLHYFDSHQKRDNKDYFLQLINIAKVDGIISDNEKALLLKTGKKLGFTDEEIEFLMKGNESSSYHPPVELSEKFAQFYEIIRMTMADGIITEDEKKLARLYAAAAGFKEQEILLLLETVYEGVKSNKDEDDLFAEYKKKRMRL